MGHGSHGSWVKISMGHLGHGSLWVTHSLLCCIPMRSLILTQYRSVTDRQTSARSIYSACKDSFVARCNKFHSYTFTFIQVPSHSTFNKSGLIGLQFHAYSACTPCISLLTVLCSLVQVSTVWLSVWKRVTWSQSSSGFRHWSPHQSPQVHCTKARAKFPPYTSTHGTSGTLIP